MTVISPQPVKAILFDMDGVIVNSEPLHHRAYHMMFAEVGIEVSAARYSSFTGQATLPICQRLCAEYGLAEKAETLVALKRKHFKDLFENDNDFDLIPGVLELIKQYHAKGLVLILASSASMPNINQIFDRFDLDQYFTAKLSGADLKASKPHPEIFIKAAEATGFGPHQCVVIEDSDNGLKAANAAGIFCVAYNSADAKGQNHRLANKVISSFTEIYFDALQALVATHE